MHPLCPYIMTRTIRMNNFYILTFQIVSPTAFDGTVWGWT